LQQINCNHSHEVSDSLLQTIFAFSHPVLSGIPCKYPEQGRIGQTVTAANSPNGNRKLPCDAHSRKSARFA
ncbi:MAG: hypothetical protein KDA71_20490, partial [Planctomycetales bacterium]|nr:hypothetical protein [Planctomycetales bacterium]